MTDVISYYANCPECGQMLISKVKDYLWTRNYDTIPEILDWKCPNCNTLVIHNKNELKRDFTRYWGDLDVVVNTIIAEDKMK